LDEEVKDVDELQQNLDILQKKPIMCFVHMHSGYVKMRNKKTRNCRDLEHSCVFKPTGIPLNALEIVNLIHDEFEAMRLCDKEGHNQEEAGKEMGISRGTVQRLLYSGRKKIVDALLNAKAINIICKDLS